MDGPTLRVVPLGRMSGGLMAREARAINPDRTDANAPLIRPISRCRLAKVRRFDQNII